MLILEGLDFAIKRGAPILAEIVGYGMSGDAFHITAPDETADGAVRAMRATLADAGILPEQVSYINAHGTSTPYNDRLETLAIKKVFGDHAYKIPVSSTKSMTGHLLGGAGGLEAGITALALHDQIVPPTMNLENPDPGLRSRLRAQPRAQGRGGVRTLQLLRLRRHQRRAAVEAVSGVARALEDPRPGLKTSLPSKTYGAG